MNKVALTLDSGHALMREVALGLAEAGYDLALHGGHGHAGMRETVHRIQRMGRRALLAVPGPPEPGTGVADGESDADALAGAEMDRVVGAVRDEYGRLDVLVTRGGPPEDRWCGNVESERPDGSDPDVPVARSREVRRAVETALRIPYHAICQALPLLSASRGVVINVVDREGGADSAEGLIYLTRLMAGGMAPGVRVNAVTVGADDPVGQASGARPEQGMGGRDGPGWSRELLRTVLFLLGQPYVNGEVVRTGSPRTQVR